MASFSPLVGMILLIGIRNVAFSTAQQVFLSSNNPTPSHNNTVDLICYYPDVMEMVDGQPRYLVTTPSWRVNGERLFPDGDLVDQMSVNQTASRLRVRIDPTIFTGDPVNFTCYLPLTSGGEDSASTVVDPQGSGNPMASFVLLTRTSNVTFNNSTGAVLLSLNNPTPCYNDTVDLICYYPDVMGRYTVIAASWRVNGELIFPDGNVFDQQTVNQTVSTLRVRVDPANFTGDPVNFTCYLPLTGGGEDNASTMVDPQDTAKPPILADPEVNGTNVTVSWNHTNKGPCFNHLTFSYNITWVPQRGEEQSGVTGPGATEYIITNLMSDTDYRVELVGFAPSDPPVFSIVATVNFTTGVSPNGKCGGGGGANIAVIVLALVVAITITVSSSP